MKMTSLFVLTFPTFSEYDKTICLERHGDVYASNGI